MVAQRSAPAEATGAQQFDLGQLEVGGRRSRFPEVALGLLLIVGSALGALAWQTFDSSGRLVLAAREPIGAGELVTAADLQSVELASDDALNLLADSDLSLLVDQVAKVDIAAGTLMTVDLVGPAVDLAAGQAEVGLSIELADLTDRATVPGSLVDVVLVPTASDAVDLFDVDEVVLVARAVVVDVTVDGPVVRLSLAVPDDDAARIARAAALDRVRLIAVSDLEADGSAQSGNEEDENEDGEDGGS